MQIAITGATGRLGRLIVEKLRGQTDLKKIVAIVRDPHKAAALGISVRRGDYDEQKAWPGVLAGIDTLLLILSPANDGKARQHRGVIDAAISTGVRRIVYTSVLHADRSSIASAS